LGSAEAPSQIENSLVAAITCRTNSQLKSILLPPRRLRFDRAVVAAIVGHEVGNITNDVYSGGPDDAVRRACIESVTLPTGQVGDTKAA
jgi:hypothetical protein